MSKYTVEQVDLFAIANDENINIPSCALRWLRDYATLLRERESANVHDLVKTGDPDASSTICDRNGEVVLAYCRRCGKGEADLDDTCDPAKAAVTDIKPVAWRCRERNGMGHWRYIEYNTRSPDSYELRKCEIQNVYASPFNPDGMTLVEKEDANSYCRILSLLGMEEEGDPVEWVQKMLASTRVQEGWQLVPVDPTDEMIDRGTAQHECEQGDPWYASPALSDSDCVAIYKAMLAAATKPETEE